MSLPDGWTALPFDAARGVPQAVPIAGPVPGLRAVLVTGAGDLPRLLCAPVDQVVHDAALRRAPVGATAVGVGLPIHIAAHRQAVAALTAPPPDSLSTAATSAVILVIGPSGVLTTWPALPDRALPVAGDGRLLGELWIDDLRLAAGSLVRGGECGSRISVGWRPVGGAATQPRPEEEDPYAGLI
ncbi:hypothetical protein [Micromonospora sp. NPDC049679]|uniref:hypothetical protein n=1 Tax=Micromonospora sp. NPDC049679 TaxID=3155920 RepID=UPI0033E9363D